MRYRILMILWLLSDLLLFVGTYALAYFLRVGWIFSSDFPFDKFINITVIVAPGSRDHTNLRAHAFPGYASERSVHHVLRSGGSRALHTHLLLSVCTVLQSHAPHDGICLQCCSCVGMALRILRNHAQDSAEESGCFPDAHCGSNTGIRKTH